MAGVIASIPKFQFLSLNGDPLAGGTLTVYVAGTTTPTATWQDSALTIANTNPIVLDGRGECVLWLDSEVVYKFVLKDFLGALQWTQDNIASAASLAVILGINLAASGGSALVGFLPSGSGAVTTTLQAKVRESMSTLDFLTEAQKADALSGNMSLDLTAPLQSAINAAAAAGKDLLVIGKYKIVPVNAVAWEGTASGQGAMLAGLVMASNMRLLGVGDAVLKIADNISTDAAPKRMAMFFSNGQLSNLLFDNLTLDMNGANNKISPARPTTFNRFQQAHIMFSGTLSGVAARGDNVTVRGCKLINGPGVSCIVMAQSNTAGVTLGTVWMLKDNQFLNNGLDTDDHSSVFGWATDVDVMGNVFRNPAMHNAATHVGGLVAYEVHGSNTKFFGNTIDNYNQGLWISSNLTESAVKNTHIHGNTARVSQTFCDFYSANLSVGASSESALERIDIHGNTIEITADAIADTVKSCFKIGARRQPSRLSIQNNVCRSLEVTKNTVMALVIVSPGQLDAADAVQIRGNTAAGLNAGLVVFFGGTGASLNVKALAFENNKLGNLIASPGSLYQNRDVVLYGGSTGKVESLRLGGLEQEMPVFTDAPVGGRATVFGKSVLDMPVVWSGVTIGNGSYSKKIALDTDAGHLLADIGFIAGATTTYSGNIAPTIAGVTADATAMCAAVHLKSGAALALPALIFNTTSVVSLYQAGGVPFDSAQAAVSSNVFVNACIPCRFVTI